MTFEGLGVDGTISLVLSICAAYVLAIPLGWERKTRSHAYVGLRVFPLVSVSSCVYVILAQYVFTDAHSNEQSDVLQGLMTGIGFIGAGTIMKQSDETHGVATAAAIWATGAIGAAVGYGYWVIALGLSVLSVFILSAMPYLGRHIRRVFAEKLDSAAEG